eukprot:3069842-Amphidinium_carterae.1
MCVARMGLYCLDLHSPKAATSEIDAICQRLPWLFLHYYRQYNMLGKLFMEVMTKVFEFKQDIFGCTAPWSMLNFSRHANVKLCMARRLKGHGTV